MRLRNIKGADEFIEQSKYVIKNPTDNKGNIKNSFEQLQPLHIEIGMGKGRFIINMAKSNPNINYIGIELYSSVLLRALQKLEEETCEITNLKFLCMNANDIVNVFEKGEIDRIYLNFSDPWPKDRHAKRRLPSKEFLERYDQILDKNGTIEFKTDNQGLFEFALEEVPKANWNLISCTKDLHHDEAMCKGNVMTEYEEKFSSMGNPIYKYIINRKC